MKLKRLLYTIFVSIISVITVISPAASVYAADESIPDFFYQNKILYYSLTATACYTTSGHSDGSDVDIVGDAIVLASKSALLEKLPKANIIAKENLTFEKGITEYEKLNDKRRILVYAFGSDAAITASLIKTLVEKAGSNTQIIFTTLKSDPSSFTDSNIAIRTAAQEYSNITLADWSFKVDESKDPSALIDTSDKASIHTTPTSEGQKLFATTIQKAVNEVTKMTSASTLSTTSSGYSRLKEAVALYGEKAMEMQREFGTPWEVVLAQMQMESSVGTAGVAVSGANNNWLGITGTGDAGSYGRWAVYSSVEASIEDWAGWRVLRNGAYDDAFAYLQPGNYDLQTFVTKMISHYAPSSDGNDENIYVSSVMSFINGPIKEAREALGWPSSEEFAKQENITIGGKYPLGSDSSSTSSSTKQYSTNCGSGAGNGDINKTAISLSWPNRDHAPTDPNAEYQLALNASNGVGTRREGDVCSIGGYSCDAFVATVMRYSEVDPNFPCCGVSTQINYLTNHPELYEEIPNIGNASNLQPGDIRIDDDHIEMYVILEDGSGHIASASHCDRTADHAGDYYAKSSYRIFRYKG